MRRYHVVVEFSGPIGHARAFAHLSHRQVERHFILPWAKGRGPMGPSRDVAIDGVSRLRVFRAGMPEAFGPASGAVASGVGADVTHRFLYAAGLRAPATPRRSSRLAACVAAIAAALAIFDPRKRKRAAGIARPNMAARMNGQGVSHG